MTKIQEINTSQAPTYDRSKVTPGIVHFGMGNFHRAHQAMYADQLLRQGKSSDWGICGVGFMPRDAQMRKVMQAQNNLYTLVLKHPNEANNATIIGSIVDYLYAPEQGDELLDLLVSEQTKIVSLTVTEGGYNIDDVTGEYLTSSLGAIHDSQNPTHPRTPFGFIVEALRRRKANGTTPFTVMSCDNLPGNGKAAQQAVVSQAKMNDPEFAEWISNNVAFPNSMVDRITPVTTDTEINDLMETDDIEDDWPVACEPFCQWILEDNFSAGRPELQEVGVQLVEDVVPYELMKLRILNAAHQSIAHWGRLLGIEYAHEAAADPDIAHLTKSFLTEEARTTLYPVPGINLDEYVDSLFERFTNHKIADSLARLAQDASQRMPKFVIPTIIDRAKKNLASPLGASICSAWALGMEGRDENGEIIVVDDIEWQKLSPLIRAQENGDATALIRDEQMFANLGDNAEFIAAYVGAMKQIQAIGVRETMRQLAGTFSHV